MARLPFTLTLLLLLFTFTYARTPFDFPKNEVNDRDPSNSMSASDANPALLLPTDTVTSETNKVGETEPQTVKTITQIDVENNAVRVGMTEDLKVEIETQTLHLKRPFMIVTLRLINLHSRHGCHHGMKPMMLRPQIQRPGRSYGHDMILDGEKKEIDPEMSRGNDDRKEFDLETFRRNGEMKESHSEMLRGDTEGKVFHPEMFRGNAERKEFHPEMFSEDAEKKEFDPEMFRGKGEMKEFDPEMFRGNSVRQIPAKPMKFHHEHHHDQDHEGMPFFPSKHHDHDRFGKQSFRKPFRRDKSEEDEKKEEGGFLNEFRKFVDHHF